MSIYNNTMHYIKKNGTNRRQVEIAAGIANGSIASWRTKVPGVDKLEAVANILGVHIINLLYEHWGDDE